MTTKIGQVSYTDTGIFKEGNFIEDLTVKTSKTQGRYVRVTLETPGNCPADHVRSGQPSRVYIDEIVLN